MEKKTIAVLGMMCAVCAANVERKLNGLEGVRQASVNLPGRTVLVEYDAERISLQQMKDALAGIGYDMVIEEDRNVEAIEHNAFRLLRRKVLLSWFFALMVMTLSMGWLGTSNWNADIRNQTCLIIALLNLVYCGRQFYQSAWRQLIHASANMDTLVALSTAVSFLFSTFNTFWGEQFWGARGIQWHTYFDASVMIITFVLTGRLLEERAKQSTAGSIRSLMGLQPKTAHLAATSSGEPAIDIPIAAVQPGDILEVRSGEKIPVDGQVCGDANNAATVDESMMTGESVAIEKRAGNKLLDVAKMENADFDNDHTDEAMNDNQANEYKDWILKWCDEATEKDKMRVRNWFQTKKSHKQIFAEINKVVGNSYKFNARLALFVERLFNQEGLEYFFEKAGFNSKEDLFMAYFEKLTQFDDETKKSFIKKYLLG